MKARNILETIDKERGNCLQIYQSDVQNIFGVLSDGDQKQAVWLLFRWFIGMEELTTQEQDSPAWRAYRRLRQLQESKVQKYVKALEHKSESAQKREANRRNRLAKGSRAPSSHSPAHPYTPLHTRGAGCDDVHI